MTPPVIGARGARAGFTLVELMAVLVILGILLVVLLPRLGEAGDAAHEKLARAGLVEIEAAIAEYEDHYGDFPPSRFDETRWGAAPNATNVGSEALVLSLWSQDWSGTTLPEEKLVNLDGDASSKPLARLAKPGLFEIADGWGNPVAYVHRRDYGKPFTYLTEDGETGEPVESTVVARKIDTTGGWANANRFQLISAGLDGRFGTEDDLGNWR